MRGAYSQTSIITLVQKGNSNNVYVNLGNEVQI